MIQRPAKAAHSPTNTILRQEKKIKSSAILEEPMKCVIGGNFL